MGSWTGFSLFAREGGSSGREVKVRVQVVRQESQLCVTSLGRKMHSGLSRARSKRRDIPKYRHLYLSSFLRPKYLVCPHLFHLITLDIFQLESRYWVISSWLDVFKSSPLQGKKNP